MTTELDLSQAIEVIPVTNIALIEPSKSPFGKAVRNYSHHPYFQSCNQDSNPQLCDREVTTLTTMPPPQS